MARKLSETVQLKLRFREELRRKLEKMAERNDQSINSEIIKRLERSFDVEERRDEAKNLAELLNGFIAESADLDRKTLKMMVGDRDDNTMLLRIVARELTDNPNWASNFESKNAFADRIHSIVIMTDFAMEKAK